MQPIFTLFHTDDCERQAVKPIGEELARRGYEVRYSEDLREAAEVGVYCSHAVKPNSRFSAIMLHDMAQRHDIWPHFWRHEPWDRFDAGFLPGKAWEERWLSQSGTFTAHPKQGVYRAGWPKADLILSDQADFEHKVASLRSTLHLPYEKTILYAPSWENDGKQDEFVRALIDLPVNLLLKQAPWPARMATICENIRQMNSLHRGIAPHVHVVDPSISIMYCIGLADLLVSDESSVLLEASLHGVPSLAITDWTIPDTNPPRPACIPFDNVRKEQKSALRETVQQLLSGEWNGTAAAAKLRELHFSELGTSSRVYVDILLALLAGAQPSHPRLQSEAGDRILKDRSEFHRGLTHMRSGELPEAIQILRTLASQNSAMWQVYYALGEHAATTDQTEAALIFHETAIRKSEGMELKPALAYAGVLARRGDWHTAFQVYGRILRSLPPSDQTLEALSSLLASAEKLPAEIWRKLLEDVRASGRYLL